MSKDSGIRSLFPGVVDEDDNVELDSCSDVSDNNDLFHVEAKFSEGPRTREDKDLSII